MVLRLNCMVLHYTIVLGKIYSSIIQQFIQKTVGLMDGVIWNRYSASVGTRSKNVSHYILQACLQHFFVHTFLQVKLLISFLKCPKNPLQIQLTT